MLDEGWLTASGYFNDVAVPSLISEHVSGRRNHELFLWSVYVFEQWYREYQT